MPQVGSALPIGIRAWTTRQQDSARPRSAEDLGKVKRRYPRETLVFDTETLDETGQGLMVGVWRFYRDNLDAGPLTLCEEEGFFYPDDLPSRDPDGYALLAEYVAKHRTDAVTAGFPTELCLWPLSTWLHERLFNYGYRHRDRCTTVGFNLPFDLGAVASYFSPATTSGNRGGWSLGMWGRHRHGGGWEDLPDHPRLLMKSIDPRRTLIGWGPPRGTPPREEKSKGPGRFVDLRTLTFALTDRSFTLEGACAAFAQPYIKRDVTYGVISTELLDYAREDVEATSNLYRACLAELASHPGVDLAPHRLYSPATVGAQYLSAMGVQPPLPRHHLPDAMLGDAMSAFFGGRAEARIVRTPVPVVVVDFTSMYPAQNGLLRTWPLLTADKITTSDVTEHVRALVADPGLLDRLFRARTWADDIGVTFVELTDLDGAVLPVRARYEPPKAPTATSPNSARERQQDSGNLGIGVNPLHYNGTLVYALPDVLAAALLGPLRFTISKATRLHAHGRQDTLKSVQLRGSRTLDPRTDADPFVDMIEERHRIKNDANLDAAQRDRLELFLKITANATAYGSLARFDQRDYPKARKVTAYGPADVQVEAKTSKPEDPGPYCFPPVAASITAGARLVLAMMERSLADVGGSFAFMDTDSTAIVATPNGGLIDCPGEPGNQLLALTHDQVCTVLRRFEGLNPFGPDVTNDDRSLGRSPWKVEHNSIEKPLSAYVIAAKRYILFRGHEEVVGVSDDEDVPDESDPASDSDGTERLTATDWSEHGIGLYRDPLGTRDNEGRRIWIRQAWDYLLGRVLGQPVDPPDWANLPALTQFTISSPKQRRWFSQPDNGAPDPDAPRPGGFGLLAQADPPTVTVGLHPMPATRYFNNLTDWEAQDWYDRSTGQPLTAVTADRDASPERYASQLADGAVALRTLGQITDKYLTRPEHKSLAPDGTPAAADTVGRLRRRPVHTTTTATWLIGKEGSKVVERLIGEAMPGDSSPLVYGTVSDEWADLYVPVLRCIGAKTVAVATGVTERRARDWLTGRSTPHDGKTLHLTHAKAAAVTFARQQLADQRSHKLTSADCLRLYLAQNPVSPVSG
jgi:hypothetical protein